MFGLVVLIAVLLYLSLLVWATWRGWCWGVEKKGWRGKKRLLGAAIGFLIIYLPVLWDWIPTLVAHKYYCEKDAGFWVYKTLDQWKQENPGVMEALQPVRKPIEHTPYGYIQILDGRFAVETRRTFPVPLLTTVVDEEDLVDRKTGATLAKAIEVHSGAGVIAVDGGVKFWLNQNPCTAKEFWKYIGQLEQMRGKK